MSRNFSRAVVGSVGSVQCDIVHCSSLYLFLRSIVVPQIHSLSITCRVLIFCTCHVQGVSPFFAYFGFFCLQVSSVSNSGPDTKEKKPLIQAHFFSCAMGKEGGTMQTNIVGMYGEWSQWMDHSGFATAQGNMCFLDPHYSGSRVLCKGIVPSGPCILYISQV